MRSSSLASARLLMSLSSLEKALLAGVYAIKSAQGWLDLEIEFARKHNKPVIAIPPAGEKAVSNDILSFCDGRAGWCAEEIIAALDQARALPRYAAANRGGAFG